ncbi:hypothetical protein FRB96_004669 [Tulasnella sp. 330]|nr:hypothetical protein FRB96_004669 [Tulasnella sp. 330]KAG8878788.1 hypothetical protein FRB97_002205 [Tulasnella sp. 331]KAG8888577.1 hypothetical protein FRB98_007341 [Tulasnella sp. 332]
MDSSSKFPEYYILLNIPRTASTEDVRTAYKRESLRTHPDRLQKATPAERKAATERFQAVADAYYVLSDPARRREYDILLQSRPTSSQSSDPSASNNFFADFAKYFSGGTGTGTSTAAQDQKAPESAYGPGVAPERPNPDGVFTDVFEELLRPEVESKVPLWSWLGTASGAGIGFIMANIPGALVGGAAGNRLGAIRDAKGKPVGQVFMQLGGTQKAEILRLLAMKVLGSVI